MNRALFVHLVFMLLGYALAVLTATSVVCLVFGAPTVFPDQGQWGSFYRYMRDLPAMFMVGLMMSALYGLPGWLISVIAAEWRQLRGAAYFAIAGILTAALAIFIGGRGKALFPETLMNIAILIGGLFGGLAYWAIAGRRSGGLRIGTNSAADADADGQAFS